MQATSLFDRIILPVDGSLPSLVAQELAVFIAKRFSSHVLVLHVAYQENTVAQAMQSSEISVGPAGAYISPYTRSTEVLNEVADWYLKRGGQIITEAAARFREENLHVEEKLVPRGNAAEEILKEAETGGYSIIILGNNGEEERDPRLGSVARNVANHSRIPVLICRNKVQVSRILLPITSPAKDEKAIRYADAIAARTGARILLLHVQDPVAVKLKPEDATAMGKHLLFEAAGKFRWTMPERKLEQGSTAKKTVEIARKENIDLIIMHSASQTILDDDADYVAHYADRPLLITK
jgi:nucleotide-binding universal stress UspA family protein